MTATKTTVDMGEVESEIIDAMTQADNAGRNWWAVRVGTDGVPYISEEVSRCESESEYFGHAPYPVTVWSMTANSSSSPSDGAREWDDCEETDAEFFAIESPSGLTYKRDWCYPADRDDCPACVVPKKLGGWVDLDLSEMMDEIEDQLGECEWLEVRS